MNKLIGTTLLVLFSSIWSLNAQVTTTANDAVLPYSGKFRPASNVGFFPPFSEYELANIAAGNEELDVPGVGVKSFRPSLSEFFMEEYGYDFFTDIFDHYQNIGLEENTVIIGFPQEAHQDPGFYCPGVRSELFANLYTPIWDDGENGTPVNDENYFALYLYKMVSNYKDHVKFWEIWNEPGFDYSGSKGWLAPDQPGNWWTNNPDPCDYKLRAPIFHYIRILRISYDIIHTVDPESYVTVSGVGYPSFLDAILRNTDNPFDGSVSADYPHKGGAYFDVVGFHAYPHFDGTLKEWNNDIGTFDYFRHSDAAANGIGNVQDELQEVLDNYGYNNQTYPEKHWIVTECNIPRKSVNEFIGGNEVQRNFLMKAYIQSVKNNFLQLQVYKLAEERDYENVVDEFEAMGLYKKLDYNNLYFQEPTEEGIGYKTTSDLLFNKNYDENRTVALQLPATMDGAAFYDNYENYTYVLWAKTTIDESEAASAIYSFPAALGISTLLKREWDYSQTTLATAVAGQNIQLSGAPVFLTERIFETSAASGCAPLSIDFESNTFPGASSYIWHFEGGSPSGSSNPSPTVTFNNPGNFEVSLEIRNAAGNIITAQTDHVNIEMEPAVGFSEAISGPIVVFTNTAGSNSQYFQWDFGDGATSNDANPLHVYDESGSYLVELIVGNDCGTANYNETVTVEVPDDPALATTANDLIQPYSGPFRPGCNLGIYGQQWTDEQLANLAAGNVTDDVKGAGVKALRPYLPEEFLETWGYEFRVPAFQHYQNIGLEDNTIIVGFPSEQHKEQINYCQNEQSEMFAGLYADIWDNGENGTPVNDENYFALYLYKTATLYKDYVKFWEIWNEPGFDYTGERGWLEPGEPGNWWENNPDPCHYKLRAPVFHMVRMLRISYEVIKSVDQDALITFSGIGFPSFLDAVLRNTDNPEDGAVTANYPHTGGAYFDVIGFHSYPHFDGSLRYFNHDLGAFVYERHSDAAAEGILKAQHNFQVVLDDYGYNGTTYPDKHWIITECNIPRKPFSGSLGGEDPQINYMIKAYVQCMVSGILQLHMYQIGEEEDYWSATDEFDLMGLYAKLSNVSPYYQTINNQGIALKTTSDQLFRTSYDAAKTAEMNLPENIGGAAFVDINGKYTYVVWAKTTIDNAETANATYSFPAAMGITELYKKTWNFSETEEADLIEGTNIALTARPVFLTETLTTPPPPLALFGSDVIQGCPPFSVSFDNLSSNTESFLWSFPGGIPNSSTEINPVVTYNNPGSYDVTLQVFNEIGEHVATEMNYIFSESLPESEFNFIVNGSDVSFTNSSYNATNYSWDFGDGYTSIGYNPDHSYFENGQFTVSLDAINECGSVSSSQQLIIGTAPVADFKSATTNACGSFTVFFQDDSQSSPTNWQWSFPGGSPATSLQQDVLVTYNAPGSYNVTLQVSNAFGEDELTQFDYIVSEVFPLASFDASVDGVTAVFNNTSTAFAEYLWDFGDGTTSTEMNPVHHFSSSGIFDVTLTVTNTCGEANTTGVLITTIVTVPSADFSADLTTGCAPFLVQYQSLATPNTSDWLWTFPGGTPASSADPNPVVNYTTPGIYNATLVASNSIGADVEIKNNFIEILNSPTADFDFMVDGSSVSFNNNSPAAAFYSWNFGDGNISSQENPEHTFSGEGTYTVWLTVSNPCGSDLVSGEVVIASAPVAAFSVDFTSGCAPLLVSYSDHSSGNASSWFWSFPGGTPSFSTAANPIVSYFAPGIYNATLQVSNEAGSAEITQSNIVTVDAAPVAAFTVFEDDFSFSFVSEANNANSYIWSFGDGNISSAPNPTHIYAEVGSYTVTLSVTNSCGTNFSSSEIEVTSAPFAVFESSSQSNCPPFFVQFTDVSGGEVESWEWSFPGGSPAFSNEENPLVGYTEPGQYPVTLTITNATGTHTTELENYIDVLSAPIVDFSFEQNGNIVNFTNLSQYANGIIWDFGDGTISTSPDPVHEFSEMGSFVVYLTAFNNCNTVQFSQTIEINSVLSAIFSSDVIEGCAPLTVQFFDLSEPQTDGWQWVFEGAETTSSSLQNPVIVYNEPGVYPVTLTASNGDAEAMATNPAFIHVLDNPVAVFDYTMVGTTVHFDNQSMNATGYSWDFGDGNVSPEENPAHTYLEAGNYLVMLTAANECGETNVSLDIVVADAPAAAFDSDLTVGCSPLFVQFTDFSSINTTSWSWEFPGGTPASSTEQHPFVFYDVPGSYPVILTVSNASGQDSVEATDYIQIQDTPVVDFEVSVNSAIVTFINNSLSAESYFWDFGDGFISTEVSPFHLYGEAGDYNVVLTAENACGVESFEQIIQIFTVPTAFFSSDLTDGCLPLTVQFQDQSSGNTSAWQWAFEGGEPATSSEQNPVVTYNESGSFNVSLIASNASGSIANIQNNYISVTEPPVAQFNHQINGLAASFFNVSTAGVTYHWDFGDGNSSSLANPVHFYEEDGSYSVALTTENNCGNSIFQDSVVVLTLASADFSSDITNSCVPLSIEFTNLSTPNVDSWFWSFEGGAPSTSTDEHPIVSYMAPGDFDVSLVVSNNLGSDTMFVEAFIVAEDIPSAGFSFTVNENQVFFVNESEGATNYYWGLGDGETTEEENPFYIYGEEGEYEVLLIAENNCGIDTITQIVNVIISGLDSRPVIEKIDLYPNPSTGKFTLLIEGATTYSLQLNILNILGKKVYSKDFDHIPEILSEQFDLRMLPKGAYFLQLKTGQSEKCLKLVLQ